MCFEADAQRRWSRAAQIAPRLRTQTPHRHRFLTVDMRIRLPTPDTIGKRLWTSKDSIRALSCGSCSLHAPRTIVHAGLEVVVSHVSRSFGTLKAGRQDGRQRRPDPGRLFDGIGENFRRMGLARTISRVPSTRRLAAAPTANKLWCGSIRHTRVRSWTERMTSRVSSSSRRWRGNRPFASRTQSGRIRKPPFGTERLHRSKQPPRRRDPSDQTSGARIGWKSECPCLAKSEASTIGNRQCAPDRKAIEDIIADREATNELLDRYPSGAAT